MSLNKKALKLALTSLAITFAADANNSVLDEQLSVALKEKLPTLDVEFPTDASTETLLELYNLATADDSSGNLTTDDDSDFCEFKAKVGFTQPWRGGSFSAKKEEEFDCDDEKLICHLLDNNLIIRQ